MRKQWLIMALLLAPLVSVAVVFPIAKPVAAWGLTTHQFLVTESSSSIVNTSWAAAFQYYSPELLSGSTAPDQAWQDWDNHLYYPETEEYYAPFAAQTWFDMAVANFTLGGDYWGDGFFALGVASHYMVDPAICLHTDAAADPAVFDGHEAYERDINANLGTLVLDTPGEFEITNVTDRVVQHAEYSHQFLEYILDEYTTSEHEAIATNATIKAFTEDCLSMALNSTLSLLYTATLGLNAPDISITYEYVALVDYAHTNDYINYSGEPKLISLNQTLARAGYQMIKQESEITAGALVGVDLFIATCAYDAYTAGELTAISTWASSGNKSILLTGRGDYSTYVKIERPNQILDAIGAHIRVNHDNIYMLGTYAEHYNDLNYIPPLPDTAGLMQSVDTLTFFSPASLYFTDDDPVLPVVYANVTAWQQNHQSPDPTVIYDDTNDGEYGNQIPLVAVEEIGDLRLLVAGTTFFSDFDYGKASIFDNIVFLGNFLDWAANREIGSVSDVDEIGPRIGPVEFTPETPDNGQSVTFTATVTDPGGVDTVTLQYEGTSGTITVDMTASGDDYTGVIAGLSETTISVKVVATDLDGNTAVRAYFTVVWGGGGTPIDSTLIWMIVTGVGAAVVIVSVAIVMLKRR
ncbi:MAG: zinc dependent phospholipase C family protein [Candidatus Thorarchaeota archaeon]